MFGSFFNRMYYGDPRKPDLKKDNTESNRFKMFFTVLSVRFWQLIQLNLLYAIFWIPAFYLVYLQAVILHETGEPITLLFFLLFIPCLMLTGPATAAVAYIIRNWSRDEHAWVWSDFKDAWKSNWKQGLIMMLINGIVLFLISVNIQFYGAMASGNFFYLLLYYFMIMLTVLFGMMNMFIFPMIVTYHLTLMQIIRNAFILTMVKLPFTILAFAVVAGLVLLSILNLMSLPFFVIGLSFPTLISLSYVNWIFDKYINNQVQAQEEN